ncbi:receptor-like cytosolic serine/threonine-protein kinase RBK1 [Iris pallida]|uniref:Receptor-like cytosolic serine/threonine-protein kinase RBK1 n=1 Tax=Iris pallida TaxID=29817 RepID=A0AAX6GXS8_IRIPA|nr:receptor-like cytosolic serine/threonine-protein kinase RBK1 [Iris pallida]KAJ6833116.1 receptor-like cytosolic serine/threonine-protein kinase RBK1 [Iris pallida]
MGLKPLAFQFYQGRARMIRKSLFADNYRCCHSSEARSLGVYSSEWLLTVPKYLQYHIECKQRCLILFIDILYNGYTITCDMVYFLPLYFHTNITL